VIKGWEKRRLGGINKSFNGSRPLGLKENRGRAEGLKNKKATGGDRIRGRAETHCSSFSGGRRGSEKRGKSHKSKVRRRRRTIAACQKGQTDFVKESRLLKKKTMVSERRRRK